MRISDWSSDVCSSDLIRTEFFTAQGLDDSVFPASAYIGPDALVEAALSGLASGEKVTVPTLVDAGIWDAIEKERARFLAEDVGGRVAERYTPVALAAARLRERRRARLEPRT